MIAGATLSRFFALHVFQHIYRFVLDAE
jgi:hypothetical protein